MSRIIILLIAVCFFLGTMVWTSWKMTREEKKQQKEKEARDEQTKKNTEAKESMDTGNGAADFAASLDVLSKLKK